MAVGIKKFTMEYLVPKIKVGSLKNRREDYDKIVKGVDSAMATGSSKVILSPEEGNTSFFKFRINSKKLIISKFSINNTSISRRK